MAWTIVDNTVKNSMLSQLNTALGTAAKISWQNAANTELATTSLNAAGDPFGAPSGGLMALVGVPITSTVFSAAGCTQAKFQTASSSSILVGTVAAPSGGDINADSIPTSGQQLRLDSLSLGVA